MKLALASGSQLNDPNLALDTRCIDNMVELERYLWGEDYYVSSDETDSDSDDEDNMLLMQMKD